MWSAAARVFARAGCVERAFSIVIEIAARHLVRGMLGLDALVSSDRFGPFAWRSAGGSTAESAENAL